MLNTQSREQISFLCAQQ